MPRFSGKTVLITGAGSGIGRTTALAFSAEGAEIIVNDINSSGGAETVELILQSGGKAGYVAGDMSKKEQIRAMFEEILRRYKGIDIAVNNAGIGGTMALMTEYDDELWDRIIAVNQSGVFYCMKEELRHMQARGQGCIVNVSSVAGLKAQPYASAYVASKHAVVGLTKTAALEYARFGIRVNAVCPVFTTTPMVESLLALDPSLEGKFKKGIPLRRFAEPEDMANAVLWLCDDASKFVTGLCLPVDGGLMA